MTQPIDPRRTFASHPADADYCSPAGSVKRAPLLPSLAFYRQISRIVLAASAVAKRGNYSSQLWLESSLAVRDVFERCGVRVRVQGTRHIASLAGKPCVFIGNHMSTAETFLLGAALLPFGKMTYVVKQSLIEYPVFKHIMIDRDPVVVGRQNPRDDLIAVMEGGQQRLANGISIVIFPQRTRRVEFDREQFNTIGVKLAKRAAVPVIPVALKTDAWTNGKRFKDFGKFYPGRDAEFVFGEPIEVGTKDKEAHLKVVEFVEKHLREWGLPVAGF